MAATDSTHESAPTQEGVLTIAARTVGRVVGKTAKAIGLEHADAAEAPTARGSKTVRSTGPKRLSSRGRRKDEAKELKAQASSTLPKDLPDLGVPYRRVMGKPAANWTIKDIGYVRGLIAKHSAGIG